MIKATNKTTIEKLSSDFQKASSGKLIPAKEIDWKTYGQGKAIVKLMNEHWFEGQRYIEEMNEKISNHDISDIFTAEALINPSRISQIKLNIEEIKKVYDEYEKKIILITDRFPRKIGELSNNFSDDFKQESLSIYNKAKQDDLEYFRIAKSYMSELEIFVDFIKSKQPQMTMKNSKIFFDLREDTNTYKKHVYKLIHLENEETKWRQGVQLRQKQILEELESIAENLEYINQQGKNL
jgi:hypothetical protein